MVFGAELAAILRDARKSALLRMTAELLQVPRLRPLPLQLSRQRAGRVAEQFLYRCRVELIDAFEILGVDAAGHEQAIDPETVGAGEIGPHGISDRKNPT